MRLKIKTFTILCLGLSLLSPNLALSHSNHGALNRHHFSRHTKAS